MRCALRQLPPAGKLGVTCLILVMLGGFAASLAHMHFHHENRDEKPGLSMDDIRGAYHGIRTVAPLLTALERNHPAELPLQEGEALSPAQRDLLLNWLNGDRISGDYDSLELGDAAPAEILDRCCVRCHQAQATGEHACPEIPLMFWPDIEAVAFSRDISPTSIEILTISTHTHALTLAALTLVTALLAMASGLPRRLTGIMLGLIGLALLADVAGQWLARPLEPFVWAVVIGGSIYGILTSLLLVIIAIDLWLPGRANAEDAAAER